MRYLLEALEADRERYPDLQKVYAFAPCESGNEEHVRALWCAKAVEAILYTANNDDHSSLYDNLCEWRRYAEDPTKWRREQLRALLNESPASLPDAKIRDCVALLAHGDASQLLGELSPSAEWLPVLVEQRIFGRQSAGPGDWIATRLNDADMIRACAGLAFFDGQTRRQIDRAVEREQTKLAPVRVKAWQLMLLAKHPETANDLDVSWYQVARKLALRWADSHFLLVKRLWLFTLVHDLYTPSEAAASVRKLDDDAFWESGAQVELMRLLTTRWMEFDSADRSAIEARLRQGIARDLFPPDAFQNDGEWASIRNSSIFKRLKRIEAVGGVLATDSHNLLKEISARYPQWKASARDRDDFSSWHDGVRYGFDGHPELLEKIADDGLVKEAMRLQREQYFEEGDIWRKFCSADPGRALQGLRQEANNGRWEPAAWRDFLWAAGDNGEPELQFELADLLLRMPDAPLEEHLPSVTSWIRQRREVLSVAERPGGPRFLRLWDHLASLTYRKQEPEDAGAFSDDLLTQSLNSPGGILAWTLLDSLIATEPRADDGLGPEFKPRFDKIVAAKGGPGLLGCAYIVRALAYFDWVDPAWTKAKLTPLFSWKRPEALAMWRSYSQAPNVGSSRLFNALNPAMLKAFERSGLSDREFDGLVSKLLGVGLWHQRGQALDYDLTNSEIKRALTAGPRPYAGMHPGISGG